MFAQRTRPITALEALHSRPGPIALGVQMWLAGVPWWLFEGATARWSIMQTKLKPRTVTLAPQRRRNRGAGHWSESNQRERSNLQSWQGPPFKRRADACQTLFGVSLQPDWMLFGWFTSSLLPCRHTDAVQKPDPSRNVSCMPLKSDVSENPWRCANASCCALYNLLFF